ncbi:type I-D CRISPR-associated protein Cas7/Csc2 [Laceyella sacchari]|nr:type I-D CRISPR-associated protein Cas7/Csc2 [Laceyella sacchari]
MIMKGFNVTWKDCVVKKVLDQHLLEEIPKSPQRVYVSMVILREFHSTAVLTTEGQHLDVEMVRAGRIKNQLLSRVVLQKRKQVAPERRTGRAFNRQMGWGETCDYMKPMCGECPDCLLYGFAAISGEGAQRSRVLTDSGFSIRQYEAIQRSITLNAIQDTTQGGIAGSAFAEREHIRPQVFFPTIETAVDVTSSELVYILRNILSTTRYGAESNRQGYVKNHIIGLLFTNTEIMSNLELTQRVFDYLIQEKGEKIHEEPLVQEEVRQAMLHALDEVVADSYLPTQLYAGEELESVLSGLRQLWKSEEGNREWLKNLAEDHQAYLKKRSK